MTDGVEERFERLLEEANQSGGFPWSLVCTDQGLLLASAGRGELETTAAVACLFDDVVSRAERDLSREGVDEVSIRDSNGRLVVRPLGIAQATRMFLAVAVPSGRPWRRVTNLLVRHMQPLLAELDSDFQSDA